MSEPLVTIINEINNALTHETYSGCNNNGTLQGI